MPLANWFAQKPIRAKLITAIMGMCVSALLLANIAQMVTLYLHAQSELREEMRVQPATIAQNLEAPLDFDLPEDAVTALTPLTLAEDVLYACVYNEEQQLFAQHTTNQTLYPCHETQQKALNAIARQTFTISQPITAGGRKIGSLIMAYTPKNTYAFLLQIGSIVLFISIVATVLAYWVTHYIERSVSAPILSLAKTANAFSKSGDYSLRATKLSSDELGDLVDSFNTMLEQIDENTNDLKDAITESENAKIDALRANQAKSEFLANMSHELRTPLNSLLILAEKFRENRQGNLSDRQVEAATIMHNSGLNLLTLINDILDLAKVESGKLEIHKEELAIEMLVISIREKFAHVAQEKGLGFSIDVLPNVPEIIVSDMLRIEQILRNLVSNAFKFTHEGSVRLRIFRPQRGSDFRAGELSPDHAIALAVEDTGIGIPESKQETIFEAFQQADGSTTRQYGGTGLGLSISRELSELLGGEMHLESSEGKGSVFTLYLPDGLSASNQSSDHHLTPINDDRDNIAPDDQNVVLIIEDDENFISILQNEVHERGLKSLVARRGKDAFLLLNKHPVHSIILDIELPDLSGLSILDQLKNNKNTKHLPIYIMTIKEKDVTLTSQEAIGFLTKPISGKQLQEAFATIEHSMTSPMKNILIVEDNEILGERLVELLEQQDRQVKHVLSAEDGLEHLRTATHVDCIILDMMLPGMSGIDMLDAIAADSELQQPPVIVYSSKDLSSDEQTHLQQYTQTFIHKNGHNTDDTLEDIVKAISKGKRLPKIEPPKPNDASAEPKPSAGHEPTISLANINLAGKTILVVDDDMRNTYALSAILEDYDTALIFAENGKIALDQMHQNPQIDLVLMDIMMPVMNGYEAMETIRQNNEWKDLPVIAVTAKAMKEDKQKCLDAGASDYITKPIDKRILLTMIQQYLA